MPIDERIVEKIRKLLSLGANNPESNEAEAALRKAAKMAEEYGLSLADVDKESGETKIEKITLATVQMKRYGVWMNPLAAFISNLFDCKCVITNKGENYTFVGTPTDIQLTSWYFKLIRLKTIRQGKAKFNLVKDQKIYGVGVYNTISKRLEEMFKRTREEVRTSDTKALVIVKNDAIAKRFKELFPRTTAQKNNAKLNGSWEAYEAGRKDGERMGIHAGEVGRVNRKTIA